MKVEAKVKIEFGISLLSLFPWSWLLPGSAKRVVGWIKNIGYDFVYGLPIRGIGDEEEFGKWALPIKYRQRAPINTRNVWAALRQEKDDDGYRTGLDYWARFSNYPKCEDVFEVMPGTSVASRLTEAGDLLELRPALGQDVDGIKQHLRDYRNSLVLDTSHAIEDRHQYDPNHSLPNPFGDTIEKRLDAVRELSADVVQLRISGFGQNDLQVIRAFMSARDRSKSFDVVADYVPESFMNPTDTCNRAHTFFEMMEGIKLLL